MLDIYSNIEYIEAIAQELTSNPSKLSPSKFVYTLPFDEYRKDKDDASLFERSYTTGEFGINKPNEIKSIIIISKST